LAAAEELLEDAGLTDVRVDREDSDEPPDTVLRQTPAAGTGLETAVGQEIALVVSDGPDL
jgi:beta-lactam-binding protein with PASTA domain